MQSPTISQLRETVRRVLEGEETVRLAYVFGSAAKGTLSRASDVDVAVGFREPEAALERLRLLGLLEDRLRIAPDTRPPDPHEWAATGAGPR